MLSVSKRKNEDKRKGLPRSRWFIAGIAVMALVLIAAGIFLFQSSGASMSDSPAAVLIYSEGAKMYAADFQTGERTPTTFDTDSGHINSRWKSPDGRWEIRFERVGEGYTHSDLVLEDLTGAEPLRNFGTFYGPDSTLSWSADQQWVAFTAYDAAINTSQGGHAAEIWMIYLPTGEVTRLSNNTYLDSDPFFSPDGTQIAYISAVDGFSRLYVMDVATRESRLLTPDHYGDVPRWSPDGQWLAFESWYRVDKGTTYTNHINMYIVRIDGTHGQSVTFGETEYGHLWGWRAK